MIWSLVYTKQAQKDAKKLAAAGLKPKAETLLDILRTDPFQNPPPYRSLSVTLVVPIPDVSIFSIAWSIKSSRMSIL